MEHARTLLVIDVLSIALLLFGFKSAVSEKRLIYINTCITLILSMTLDIAMLLSSPYIYFEKIPNESRMRLNARKLNLYLKVKDVVHSLFLVEIFTSLLLILICKLPTSYMKLDPCRDRPRVKLLLIFSWMISILLGLCTSISKNEQVFKHIDSVYLWSMVSIQIGIVISVLCHIKKERTSSLLQKT